VRRLAIGAVVVQLLLLAARAASAHTSSITYAELTIDGERVRYVLKLESRDLYEGLGLEADRPATREEALAGQRLLAAYVLRKIAVTVRGAVCTPSLQPMSTEDSQGDAGFYAVLTFDYACPPPIDQIGLRYDLFFDLDQLHEGRARVTWRTSGEAAPRTQAAWFKLAEREFSWKRPAPPPPPPRQRRLVRPDQIALLLALAALLAGGATAGAGARARVAPMAAGILGLLAGAALARVIPLHLGAHAIVGLGAASAAWLAIENLVLDSPSHRLPAAFALCLLQGFSAPWLTLALAPALALALFFAPRRAVRPASALALLLALASVLLQ